MPPVERKPPAPVRGADLRPPIKGMFMRFMHSMELPQLLAESYPPLWGGAGEGLSKGSQDGLKRHFTICLAR